MIGKFSQIYDLLEECTAEGLGNEFIFDGAFNDELTKISIEEFERNLEERILILKSNPEHIALREKLEEIGIDVKKIKNLLSYISNWKKLIDLDNELKTQKANITRNTLDQYVEPEKIKMNLDKHSLLLRNESQIKLKLNDLTSQSNELKRRINLTNNLESLETLNDELKNVCGEIPENLDTKLNDLNKKKEKINKEFNVLESKLKKSTLTLKEVELDIEKIKQDIMVIAKSYKYSDFSKWIEYIDFHFQKTQKLINNILFPFSDYLKTLKDIFNEIEKNRIIKNKKYLSLISETYNQFFLTTYRHPAFFQHVFKGYKEIKYFDIIEKKIVFIKEDNGEDQRRLIDFSSGEKAYAFIRAMITLFKKDSKYKILFLDEANALMDYIRSGDLLNFQLELIKNKDFDKIINILPMQKEPAQLSEDQRIEYENNGYYQEILQL